MYHPFYASPSILIQFILEEFFSSHRLILQVDTQIKNYLTSSEPISSLQKFLIPILGELVDPITHYTNSSLPHWKKGSLIKLEEYCSLLLNSCLVPLTLHNSCQKLEKAAKKTLSTAIALSKKLTIIPHSQQPLIDSDSFSMLNHAYQTLLDQFNQIIQTLPRILKTGRNDENIVYCLLRNQNSLAHIYGNDRFEHHFKWLKITPKFTKFLIQRYKTRGFDPLLPKIKQLCESNR